MKLNHWLFIAALFYFLYYILHFSFYTIDDAYIHFRIARNIAEYGLPYFNVDEKVMGSSPHLWINLVALLFKISGNNINWIPYFSWVCTVGSFFCLVALLKNKFAQSTSIVLSFLLISFFLLPTAAGLMEAPLVVFLVLLATIFAQSGRFVLAGVCAGLSLTVRVECALLITTGFFILQPKQYISYIKGFMGPVLAYIAYTLFYFGTLIPYPMISKPIVFKLSWREFFFLLPSVVNYKKLHLFENPMIKIYGTIIALTALYLLLFYEVFKQKRRDWILWLLLLSSSVLFGYCTKLVYVFSWYGPLFILPAALVTLLVLQKRTYVVGLLLFLIAFANVFYVAITNTTAIVKGEDSYFDEYASGVRVQQYLKIGEELYAQNSNALVMAAEIGALGWTFKGKILDGAGLVSPTALPYHPMKVPEDRPWSTVGAIPYQLVKDWNPDFIVSMPIFDITVRRAIEEKEIKYAVKVSYPIPALWQSNHIDIFEKVP